MPLISMSRAILACLLLIANAVPIGGLGRPSGHAQAAQPPTGEWQVTELTGSITYTTTGPAPPAGMCEPSTETYQARARDSFVELSFLEHGGQPIIISKAEQELRRVVLDYADIMPALQDYGGPAVDPSRLFVFHFEFDNGYHSNEVLDAGSQVQLTQTEIRLARMVAATRDTAEQTEITGRLATALAELNRAFGGGEGYVGSWFTGEEGPAFPAFRPEPLRIIGIEGVSSGGGEAGKSAFLVVGAFDGPRTMSGRWFFESSSKLLDCTSVGTGSGSWEARAR
jgi:hypothetical protein